MKLLLDENLPPQLVELLADLYPGSDHVHRVGLGSVDDASVWEFAKARGFAIVTKDSDFADRGVLFGQPPKVVWIRLGNCPNATIERLMRSSFERIQEFLMESQQSFLALGRPFQPSRVTLGG